MKSQNRHSALIAAHRPYPYARRPFDQSVEKIRFLLALILISVAGLVVLPGRITHSHSSSPRQSWSTSEAMRSLEGERALDHFKQNADGQSLELGSPIDRELAGGESHSYDIALASAQYMRVSVAQNGINVKLKLSGPDTTQIAEVNNQNNAQLQERVSVVADASGKYYLEVSAVEKTALAGRYTIVVEELRAATLQDAKRINAERAYAQAEILRSNGSAESLRESKEKYESALTMWSDLGDRREEANALHSIGLVHRLLGETQKALGYYNQALPLRRESGDLYGEAMTLHNIGAVYWNLGDNQKALDYYNQALPLRQAARDVWGESATLSNIGTVYAVLGDNLKALDYFSQSLPVRREARDRAGEGETLSNLSTLYLRMGELQKALDYANQSLVLRREAGDKRGEAFSLMSVATIHFTSNEYSKALEYYNHAVSLSKITGDRRGQAIALTNVGTVYLQLGESQKGLDYYSEAHPLFQAIGDRPNEAGVLGRIASIHKLMGEYQKALDYHNQSLRLSRAVGDRPAEAISVTGIGAVYGDMGEKQKAMDSYNQALPLHRQVGNRRGEASTLNSMGAIYEQLGDKQKGLEYFGQALLIQRAIGERSDEAMTLMSVARIERNRGDLNEAHAHVRTALDIIESARTNVPGQDLRASYVASKQSGYEFYVDLLIQLDESHPGEGYAAKALLTNERARARSLLETLAEVRADIRNGVEPLLLERERSLQRRLNAKALTQAQLVSSKRVKQAETVEKELDLLLSEYQDVQAQIRTNSPRYAALTQFEQLSLKDLQQLLDQDTLLLEYSLGQDRSFLWAVTPTSLTSHVLPKRADLEAAARHIHSLLTARNDWPPGETHEQRTRRVARADAEYPQAASALSQVLLGPVAAQLGTKRLLLVTEDSLQYIPFGALPVPSLSPGISHQPVLPLIVKHELVILPSASTLALLRRDLAVRPPAAKAVAVMADPVFSDDDPRLTPKARNSRDNQPRASSDDHPAREVERSARESGVATLRRLPFSRQEADTIEALVSSSKSMKAIDFAASRATATSSELGQYRILHFATHGLLNSQHPELSGLVLSLIDEHGQPQDGFLRLHDIYNLQLRADLVVLSACETALGKEIRGEGLIGLTRGFMYAGAPRVVASLWKVEDRATAELMKRFYKGMLKDGKRPAAALRDAQVEMWRREGWQAPFFWAAFTLQGEWK